MTQHFEIQPHQKEIYRWLQKVKRSAVFASMGSGKTITTLTALMDISIVEPVFPILVIAPIRVANSTWPDEVKKWNHTAGLNLVQITGTEKQRLAALEKSAGIYTINFEALPWLVKTLDTKWFFRTVIVDESTKLKGFRLRQGSARAKALAKVAHTKVDRIVLLTGTPAPNGLLDLWGQLWFIDKGERLGKSYSAFTEKWFTSDYMGYNLFPKENAQTEIQEAIKDVCITVDMTDWFPLEKPIINKVMVDMPQKAMTIYRKMEKEMFAELEKVTVESLNSAVCVNKCAQIANGALYVNDNKDWEEIHDGKLSALSSIIEEANGMPVLVAYRFKSDLARLRSVFPSGRTLGDRGADISSWNKGEVPILFIHPAEAGHGLNLQDGSNILAFFSINWSLEEHLQIIERIGPARQKQSGHKRSVFLYYILSGKTIDEAIFERLHTKKSTQEILLTAMKHHKGELLCE